MDATPKNFNENAVLLLEGKETTTSNEITVARVWYNGNKTIMVLMQDSRGIALDEELFNNLTTAYITRYPSEAYFNDVTTCSDSDNGLDYYTQGNCIDKFGADMNDGCVDIISSSGGNSDYLREIKCVSNKCTMVDYNCINGCSNGVCL